MFSSYLFNNSLDDLLFSPEDDDSNPSNENNHPKIDDSQTRLEDALEDVLFRQGGPLQEESASYPAIYSVPNEGHTFLPLSHITRTETYQRPNDQYNITNINLGLYQNCYINPTVAPLPLPIDIPVQSMESMDERNVTITINNPTQSISDLGATTGVSNKRRRMIDLDIISGLEKRIGNLPKGDPRLPVLNKELQREKHNLLINKSNEAKKKEMNLQNKNNKLTAENHVLTAENQALKMGLEYQNYRITDLEYRNQRLLIDLTQRESIIQELLASVKDLKSKLEKPVIDKPTSPTFYGTDNQVGLFAPAKELCTNNGPVQQGPNLPDTEMVRIRKL